MVGDICCALKASQVVELQATTCVSCRELWGVQIADDDILESDSSTEVKWSRHITVRVPGRAFASSVAVGVFVKEHLLRHPLAEEVMVTAAAAGGAVRTSIVDDAVYTKCATRSIRRACTHTLSSGLFERAGIFESF